MKKPANSTHFLKRPKVIICLGVGFGFVIWAVWTLYWGDPIMLHPPEYTAGQGAKYAADLSKAAQGLSLVLLVLGWILIVIGGFLGMTAVLVGQKKQLEDDETSVELILRQRGLLFGFFATFFVGIGWQVLDRSSATALAGSIATRAMPSDPMYDSQAYKACVDAKSSWLEGRMNHERLTKIVDEWDAANLDRSRRDANNRSAQVLSKLKKRIRSHVWYEASVGFLDPILDGHTKGFQNAFNMGSRVGEAPFDEDEYIREVLAMMVKDCGKNEKPELAIALDKLRDSIRTGSKNPQSH